MTTTTTTTDGPAPASDPGAVRGALVPLLFGFFPTQVLHVAATLRLADHLARRAPDHGGPGGRHRHRRAVARPRAAGAGLLRRRRRGQSPAPGPSARTGRGCSPTARSRSATWSCCSPATRCGGRGASSARPSAPASPPGTGSPGRRRSTTCGATPSSRRCSTGRWPRAPATRCPASPRPAGSTASARSSTSVAATARCWPRVLRAHPHLRGTVFDLAEGMETAPRCSPPPAWPTAATPWPATSSPPSRAARRLPGQERHPRLGRRAGRDDPAQHPAAMDRDGVLLRGRAGHARHTVVLARRADDGDERPEHARVHGRQGAHRGRVPRPARGRRVRRPGDHARVRARRTSASSRRLRRRADGRVPTARPARPGQAGTAAAAAVAGGPAPAGAGRRGGA